MTEQTAKSRRWAFTDAIFFRSVLLLALACALVTTTLTYRSIQATNTLASNIIMDFGVEKIAFVADDLRPLIDEYDAGAMSQAMADAMTRLTSDAAGMILLGPDGAILAEQRQDETQSQVLQNIAQIALKDGALRTDRDSLIVAQPIIATETGAVIGVVAAEWQNGLLFSRIVAKKAEALTLVFGVVTGVLVLAALSIHRIVAAPMALIAAATGRIASGDYATAIPQFKSGNEVHPVSNALQALQDRLSASDATRRDADMKSAALDAGSAAIMIADADFKIVYATRAVIEMHTHHSEVLSTRITGFDPQEIVGQSIDMFHKRPDSQRNFLGRMKDQTHKANLELDDITLRLQVSPIDAADGERIGYVVEWADVTETRLNAAILGSLNQNQVRAEFGHDGQLLEANAAFTSLTGWQPNDVGARISDIVFYCDQPTDPAQATFGEIRMSGPNGTSHLLGGTSPIFRQNGNLQRTVLIAADMTEELRQKEQAKRETTRLQLEQDAMVDTLSASLAQLAKGDLTIRIADSFSGGNDRIRQDFNTALARLDEAMASVISGTTEIQDEIKRVETSSTELSRRTENQTATLKQTASALSQITASISNSAEGVTKSKDVVRTAQGNAKASGEVVQGAITAMSEISKSSTEITSIVRVIDDIAFQTNLLALNAGVEAARAGDAGRGFAVVASEVRALAQRSSEAASEISTLISKSTENVELGAKQVSNAGAALKQIIASVSDISQFISHIASAAQEQSLSVGEINSAMGLLEKVTQENSDMFVETTATSQSLSRVAAALETSIQKFSTGHAGKIEIEDGATFETEQTFPAETG